MGDCGRRRKGDVHPARRPRRGTLVAAVRRHRSRKIRFRIADRCTARPPVAEIQKPPSAYGHTATLEVPSTDPSRGDAAHVIMYADTPI